MALQRGELPVQLAAAGHVPSAIPGEDTPAPGTRTSPLSLPPPRSGQMFGKALSNLQHVKPY